jgi:anti-sigma-K factor RskA
MTSLSISAPVDFGPWRFRGSLPFWRSRVVLVLSRVATVLVLVIETSIDDEAIDRPLMT